MNCPVTRRSATSLAITLTVFLATSAFLATSPAAIASTPGSAPGATLLLPYFEVDLSHATGQTTLFSVNSAGDETRIAHVVLWTDWGIPTYSFDVALEPDDVQSFNLRDLFTAGSLPQSDGTGIAGCSDPVSAPALDVEELRRQHSGQPDPISGLCSGSDDAGSQTVVGYITVDVADSCAGTTTYFPGDDGYFLDGGNGFATNDEVLWGDAFYLADDEDSAQGIELVQIPIDETAESTFYTPNLDELDDAADNRVALGSGYRARYLDGGDFDGGTELIVWLETTRPPFTEPVACDARPSLIDSCQDVPIAVYDENGNLTNSTVHDAHRLAFRLPVGGPELLTEEPFGFIELRHRIRLLCGFITPTSQPLQAWVISVMKASDRFSVGLPATRMPPSAAQ